MPSTPHAMAPVSALHKMSLLDGICIDLVEGCIYSDQNGVSRDLVLQGAQAVLSNCAGSNTVNGRSKLPGGSGGATICLSDGNGCGGCFA
jgi:hypothetical protein